ncbi:MAG: hypothetical protein U0903_11005 [Planctomycetales bacterium]
MTDKKFHVRQASRGLLVHYSIIPIIARCGYDPGALAGEVETAHPGSTRWYPDGTLAITGFDALNQFVTSCDHCYSDAAFKDDCDNKPLRLGRSIKVQSSIVSHPAFESTMYDFLMWNEAFRKWDSSASVITAQLGSPYSPELPAGPLESLPLVIFFADKKVNLKTRKAIAISIENWFRQQAETPMPGEKPIRLQRMTVRFRERTADILLDASESGQHSLNWLYLEIIYHCKQVIRHFVISLADGGIKVVSPATDNEPAHYGLCTMEEALGPVNAEFPFEL